VSRLKRISFVVEGPTDYVLLDALVEHFLNSDDYVPTRIQPPISEFTNNSGPLGGGWKGVLKWCSMIGENPDSSPLTNCDFLIIHIDADIAGEAELASLNLSAECPPAATAPGEAYWRITGLRGHLVCTVPVYGSMGPLCASYKRSQKI